MKLILVIDDDAFQHRLFDFYMREQFGDDFELLSTETVEGALELLQKNAVYAVFLDNRLHPYPNYQETLPLLQKWTGEARLFIISGDVQEKIFSESGKYGVERVLDKFDIRSEISAGLLD